jgi:ABC-type transport system involved in multi-copper enzyme maturation permease subunit
MLNRHPAAGNQKIHIILWHEILCVHDMDLLQTNFSASSVLLILLGVWLIVLIIALVSLWKRRDIIMPVRIFWMLVIFIAPVLGLVFYLLFGTKKRTTSSIEKSRPPL